MLQPWLELYLHLTCEQAPVEVSLSPGCSSVRSISPLLLTRLSITFAFSYCLIQHVTKPLQSFYFGHILVPGYCETTRAALTANFHTNVANSKHM